MNPPGNIALFLRSGLKLRHLRLAVVLDEYRQIARAASAMNVTQPAVSKALAELEHGLGQSLFERHPRGLEPTLQGLCFVRYAQVILNELDRAGEELQALGQGACASISIGAMAGTTLSIMPRIIALAKARMPGLTISVSEAPMDIMMGQLSAGRLDVVLGAEPDRGVPDDVARVHLYDEGLCVAVDVNHPLAAKTDLAWAGLAGFPWLLPPPTTKLRRGLTVALRSMKVEIPRQQVQQVQSVSTALNLGLMTQMQAVAIVSERLAWAWAERGLARVLPLKIPGLRFPISSFALRSTLGAGAIEFFQGCAQQATGEGWTGRMSAGRRHP